MRSSIQGGTGNCQHDSTSLLDDTLNTSNNEISISEAALIRKYDLTESHTIESDHNYPDIPNLSTISEHKKAAISYISLLIFQKWRYTLSHYKYYNFIIKATLRSNFKHDIIIIIDLYH